MHTPILCLIKCSKLLTVILLLHVEMTLSLFNSVEVLAYPIYQMMRVLPEMQIESSIVRKLSGFYQNTFNKTADEWVDAIYAAKVPVGVINNLEQAFQEPQVIAREMLVEMNHPQREKLKVIGSPIKLSRTPVEYKTAPPLLGEHTQAVLGRMVSSEKLAELKEKGVIG